MSVFFRKPEQRSIGSVPWGRGDESTIRGSGGGIKSALGLVPVYAATAFIADLYAAAPWAAYEDSAGYPQRLSTQPDFVRSPGVFELDLFSWKFQLATSLLLCGNAYGQIVATKNGRPTRILWLKPDAMEIDESEPTPRYFYDGRRIQREALVHIPFYVVPGSVKGLSPVGLFRTQIDTGLEAQRVAKNFFRRGGVPQAHMKNTSKVLEREEAQTIKARFMSTVSASEPLVTGMDWDYQTIQVPDADKSFLAGIKATATQIAAIYRVPPESVGGEASSQSLTYKTLEQDQIKLNTNAVRPLAARTEAVFDRYLPDPQYVKHNLDAGVRADLKTRYEAHQIAIDTGFKTDDEVRKLEELPPLTPQQREQIAQRRTATQSQPNGGTNA